MTELDEEQQNKLALETLHRIADQAADVVFRETIGQTHRPDFRRIADESLRNAIETVTFVLGASGVGKKDQAAVSRFLKREIVLGCQRRFELLGDVEGKA